MGFVKPSQNTFPSWVTNSSSWMKLRDKVILYTGAEETALTYMLGWTHVDDKWLGCLINKY